MNDEHAPGQKPRRFLNKAQVRDKTTLSYAEIDRRESRAEFPKRRRLSKSLRGRVVWWEHEVDAWMEQQPPGDCFINDAAPAVGAGERRLDRNAPHGNSR